MSAKPKRTILSKETTRDTVLRCSESLYSIARASYGPRGVATAIQQSSFGSTDLSTQSKKLIKDFAKGLSSAQELAPGRLLTQLVERHVQTYNDGGLYCTLLATLLYSRLAQWCEARTMSPLVAVSAANQALEWITSYLRDPTTCCVLKLRLNNPQHVLPLLRTYIGSKPVAFTGALNPEKELEHIAHVILVAFVKCLSVRTRQPGQSISKPNIIVIPQSGASTLSSKLLHGTVLLDLPVPLGCPGLVQHKLVALYDISLRFPKSTTSIDSERHTTGTQSWSSGEAERECLIKFGEELVRLGVGLVASQRLIHPILKLFLLRNGLIPLERLSIRHIESVQKVTGARVISSWLSGMERRPISLDDLGYVSKVKVTDLNSKQYLLMEGVYAGSDTTSDDGLESASITVRNRLVTGSCNFATILACSYTEHGARELADLCSGAVQHLVHFMQDTTVVAGSGCTDFYLADLLRTKASVLPISNPMKSVLGEISSIFLQCVFSLGKTNLCDEDQVESLLHNTNKRTLPSSRDLLGNRLSVFGLDVELGSPKCIWKVTETGEVCDIRCCDLRVCRLGAIRTAFEAATILLRVGSVAIV